MLLHPVRISVCVVAIATLSSSAQGDIRYRIHARLGEEVGMVDGEYVFPAAARYEAAHGMRSKAVVMLSAKTPECVDRSMHDRLWKTLGRVPTVIVHPDNSLDFDLNVPGQALVPASAQHSLASGKVIGYWETNTPGILFEVSVKERPAQPPRIEVLVVRDDTVKDGACGVLWVGTGDKY